MISGVLKKTNGLKWVQVRGVICASVFHLKILQISIQCKLKATFLFLKKRREHFFTAFFQNPVKNNPLNIFESKYIPVMIKSFISSQDLSLTLMLPQEVLLGDLSINAFVGHMLSCYTLIEKCFILMKTNVYCTRNEVFHYGLLQLM